MELQQQLAAGVVQLDTSSSGVVVWCVECPTWAVGVSTQRGAWAIAVEHEESVHPDVHVQRDNRDARKSKAKRRDTP